MPSLPSLRTSSASISAGAIAAASSRGLGKERKAKRRKENKRAREHAVTAVATGPSQPAGPSQSQSVGHRCHHTARAQVEPSLQLPEEKAARACSQAHQYPRSSSEHAVTCRASGQQGRHCQHKTIARCQQGHGSLPAGSSFAAKNKSALICAWPPGWPKRKCGRSQRACPLPPEVRSKKAGGYLLAAAGWRAVAACELAVSLC
jgi:hypothetical protein